MALQKNALLNRIGVLVFAMGGLTSATAVSLNGHGVGQVLLFPYYTVNAGNNTLVSIANTTAQGKALRVRFAEGENGRDALSINVYLAPHDTWTATIFDASGYVAGAAVGPAGLVTDDNSCTIPAIKALPQANMLPDGRGFVPFSNAAFSGTSADAGTADPARTREGTIEVFEMGTIVRGSPTDVAIYHGPQQNCEFLIEGWGAPGTFISAGNPNPHYWYNAPKTDLRNPTGGLVGTGYIVDAAQGTIFSYAAVALDAFRADPLDQPRGSADSVVLHTAPGDARPNLADALSEPLSGQAQASVGADGNVYNVAYAAANSVDAVSAALTASVLGNEFSFNASQGASTSYVLSYPTRRFYTDPALAGSSAIAPFTHLFSGIEADTETETVPLVAFDRDGNTPHFPCGSNGCDLSIFTPGTSVELLNFGTAAHALLGSSLEGRPGLDFAVFQDNVPVYFATEGWTSLYFDGSTYAYYGGTIETPGQGPVRFMRAALDGKRLAGMPVIGFAVQDLVNGAVRDGVLANYSSATTHRSVVNCYLPTPGNLQPAPCP